MKVQLEKEDLSNLANIITNAVIEGMKKGGTALPHQEQGPSVILKSNKELAKALGLSIPKILAMKKQGLIPYVKLGRKSEFDLIEVKRALHKN